MLKYYLDKTGKVIKSILFPSSEFVDTEPREGSMNPVTSGGVAEAVDAAKDEMQNKIDEVTLDPSAVALGNVHLLDEVTSFAADAKILVDSETNGPGQMPKDDLLKETAQNALAGNVAPEFDPTRTSENPYKAGESVVYEGKTYTFYVDHYGSWDAADVVQSEPLNDSLNNLGSRISSLEQDVDGKTAVFSKTAIWGSGGVNSKWRIGTLYSGKTLSILVSCENSPANEVKIYFSTGYDSSTIISSETKDVSIGKPVEIVVNASARYIWIVKIVSTSPDKEVTLQLLDVATSPSIKQQITDLKTETFGEEILNGTLVWGSSLNSDSMYIGDRFADKKISVLVTCANPPTPVVTIYFSTGSGSGTIIPTETRTATIGTPLEVVLNSSARYIWVFSSVVGSSNSVGYKVEYIGDLERRVEILENNSDSNIAVSVYSTSVNILKNLGDGRKQRVVFSKFGPSNIMQLKSIALYNEEGMVLSSKSTSTDSLGPYVVRAVNSADGDNANPPKFTGGCHGYNGDQTGSATASCNVVVVADGKEITNGDFSCYELSVIVTNKIQGWNTRKTDGTGREIIKETIVYRLNSFDDKIFVASEIEPLEDVVFELYYGLQIAFARDAIRFTCGEFSEWLTTSTPFYSGETLDSVDGKSTDGFYQEMGLDRKGLGHFAYTGDNPKAFRSNTKGYYSLIRSDVNVSAGKIIRLAGYYSFNFIGNEVVPIKFDSFEINNAAIDKYFSIADLPEGTYKLKYYLSGENNGTGYVNVYTASNHQSTGIISTYTNVVQGQELTISVTSDTKIIWFFINSPAKTELSYILYQ